MLFSHSSLFLGAAPRTQGGAYRKLIYYVYDRCLLTRILYMFCVLTHHELLPAHIRPVLIREEFPIILRRQGRNNLDHLGDTFFLFNRIG